VLGDDARRAPRRWHQRPQAPDRLERRTLRIWPLQSTSLRCLKRAFVLAALLMACQAAPAATPSPNARPVTGYVAEPAFNRGGSLVLADWEAPDSIDPIHATTANDLRIASLLFAPLWTMGPDLSPRPDLLRIVPTLTNGGVKAGTDGVSMTVDLMLAPNLRWSDGVAITAGDVVFTVDAICSSALPGRDRTGFDHIVSQEQKSPTEVVWHFGPQPKGACGLTADLASGLYPALATLGPRARLLPAHRLASVPEQSWPQEPFFQHPDVASGPFAYQGGVAGRLLALAANPAYASGRRHGAWLDGVSYRFYSGKAAMIAGLQAGEADVGFHLLPGDAADLQGTPGSATVISAGLQGEFLSPNHATNTATGRPPPWVGNPAILAALEAVVDKKALDDDAFGGAATISPSLFPALLASYSQAAAPGPSLADAKATLADAKPAFTLLTVCDSAPRQVEQAELVRQWNEAGANVTPACAPRGQFFAADGPNATGGFDMSLYSNTWEPDPGAWAALPNWSRCQDPRLEQDFAAGASTFDAGKRRTAYLDAAAEWLRYNCTIPLYLWPSVVQRTARLHNFLPNPTLGMDTWNGADWWLSAP
jgi:peptide/nickel transport system substrate-binding protein